MKLERHVRRLTAAAALLSALAGCSSNEDLIVKTGAGKELGAPEIDREPLALLPGNVVGIASVDTTKLFASPFGAKIIALLNQRLPVPASAGYQPSRDLTHLYVGFYAMQGADLAGVAVGSFDKSKIEAAANGVERTPQGVPLKKEKYAGHTLFTAAGVGFCVLTDHTALFGDDTGIRRALDRVSEGRVRRQTLPWMDKLLASSPAPIVAGADLRAQALPEAASSNLPFLNGLETLALVGNFADPGINFAGTLVYGDDAGAKAGADNVQALAQKLGTYATLMALIGIPQPVRKLEAEAKGKEAAFVLGVDAAAVGVLLDKIPDFLGSRAISQNP